LLDREAKEVAYERQAATYDVGRYKDYNARDPTSTRATGG